MGTNKIHLYQFLIARQMGNRRLLRSVAARIPVDVLPLRVQGTGEFLKEVEQGEVVYVR